MKLTTDYFLACENAFVDPSKRVSIINTFDTISGDTLPILCPQIVFTFSLRVKLDKKSEQLIPKLTFTSPSGEELLEHTGINWGALSITPQIEEEQITSGRIAVGAPVFKEFGAYVATLFVNDKEVASRTITVRRQEKKSE